MNFCKNDGHHTPTIEYKPQPTKLPFHKKHEIYNTEENSFFHIKCHYHKNINLTNFCKNEKCLMPLCPECIDLHVQDHYQRGDKPIFQRLENIHQETLDKIINLEDIFQKHFDSVFNDNKKSEGYIRIIDEKIDKCKMNILSVIEDFFKEFRKNCFVELTNFIDRKDEKFKNLLKETNLMQKKIQKYHHKLQSNKFLKTLIKVVPNKFFNDKINLIEELKNQNVIRINNLPEFEINKTALENIKHDLNDYINLYSKKHKFKTTEKSQVLKDSNKVEKNNTLESKRDKVKKDKNHEKHKEQDNIHSHHKQHKYEDNPKNLIKSDYLYENNRNFNENPQHLYRSEANHNFLPNYLPVNNYGQNIYPTNNSIPIQNSQFINQSHYTPMSPVQNFY